MRKGRLPIALTAEEREKRRKANRCNFNTCKAKRGAGKLAYCNRHNYLVKKARDPIREIFYRRRGNAARRGKDWTITLDNFRDWCLFTNYHNKTSRSAYGLTIDRKDSRHGYHIWNIRTLRYDANSSKGAQYDGGEYVTDENGSIKYIAPNGVQTPF
jgi:hypothetical protein